MAEERGEFVVYRLVTDGRSGRQLEPFLIIEAATRDEAERRAAQLTGVRPELLSAVGLEFVAPDDVEEARRRTRARESRAQ